MSAKRSRREFLADVGRGTLIAAIGSSTAADLGLAQPPADSPEPRLNFRELEGLVALMQETPASVSWRSWSMTEAWGRTAATGRRGRAGQRPDVRRRRLRRLPHDDGAGPGVAHGARAAGGRAAVAGLQGALSQHQPHPGERRPQPGGAPSGRADGAASRTARAARPCAKRCGPRTWTRPSRPSPRWPRRARGGLQRPAVRRPGQHRGPPHGAPLPRLGLAALIGQEQAHALLRQSVRYCVKSERELAAHARIRQARACSCPGCWTSTSWSASRSGTRQADDAWVDA